MTDNFFAAASPLGDIPPERMRLPLLGDKARGEESKKTQQATDDFKTRKAKLPKDTEFEEDDKIADIFGDALFTTPSEEDIDQWLDRLDTEKRAKRGKEHKPDLDKHRRYRLEPLAPPKASRTPGQHGRSGQQGRARRDERAGIADPRLGWSAKAVPRELRSGPEDEMKVEDVDAESTDRSAQATPTTEVKAAQTMKALPPLSAPPGVVHAWTAEALPLAPKPPQGRGRPRPQPSAQMLGPSKATGVDQQPRSSSDVPDEEAAFVPRPPNAPRHHEPAPRAFNMAMGKTLSDRSNTSTSASSDGSIGDGLDRRMRRRPVAGASSQAWAEDGVGRNSCSSDSSEDSSEESDSESESEGSVDGLFGSRLGGGAPNMLEDQVMMDSWRRRQNGP